MKSRTLKIIIFISLLIFYGSFLIYKINLPAAQDLPRQMQNGHDVLQGHFDVLTKNVYSYTEPNQHFANHHWFYGVMMYVLHGIIGYSGMSVFKIVLLLSMFTLLFWLAQKRGDFWLTAVFSIPTIFILINRTALRPEIFSFLFAVLFLYFLLDVQEHPEHTRMYWLIPLQLIWVNTHLFFAVGIFMVLGMLVQNLILHRKEIKQTPLIRKLFILFLSLIVVSFINPFGLWGVVYSLLVNTSSTFPIGSGEITPLINAQNLAPGWDTISATAFFPSLGVLFLSFIFAFIYRRKNKMSLFSNNYLFYLLASIGSAAVPFIIVRGLPLFAIIFLPAIVNNLHELWGHCKNFILSKGASIKKIFMYAFVAGFVILISLLTITGQKRVLGSVEKGIGLAEYSEAPAQFFKDNELEGPIFNDTDIGSYLIGELYPGEKVFADNRFGDAYSASFFTDEYLPMIEGEDAWQKGLEKYNFNVIFFYHYDALDGARDFLYRRIYDPAWAWVYVDNNVVILVRNIEKNQDVVRKYQITYDNLADKLQFLTNSSFAEDHLNAADIFGLVGQVDLSTKAYLQYVSLNPHRGKVWMVLGRTELIKADQAHSNPYVAATYLERALQEGWKTWETYSYLTLAYFRTGQLERAKQMVQEELRVAPDSRDAEKWLGLIADEELRLKNERK
jgi:tetratricopeptide (TPR) repeat protein